MSVTYQGSCHCQAVQFEVDFDEQPKTGYACNCSICGRAGWMLQFIPVDHFRLMSGEDSLTDYQFNKMMIHHTFCKVCGVRAFSRGKDAEGKESMAVNLRCLHDFDVDALEVQKFDGRSL